MAQFVSEAARREVQARGKDYLRPDKSGQGWICPLCGSGSGKNGTGLRTKDGIHFTCFAGCFSNEDIIDIIGRERGIEGYKEKLEAACEALGVNYNGSGAGRREYQKQAEKRPITQPKLHNTNYITPVTQPAADYTAFYKEAASHIGETDYHRGLSKETLERFWIGYVAEWRHPKRPQDPLTPRLIIPTSASSYLARRTDGGKDNAKMKVGSVHIFNSKALWESTRPLFITEGELDALAIIEAGGNAVGLGSASNVKTLLTLLEERKPAAPYLLLSLDADKAGDKALEELEQGLTRLEIQFYRKDASAGHKDPSEALEKDRAALAQAVAEGENMELALRYAEWEKLETESGLNNVDSLLKAIEERKGSAIPTGFENLDAQLDGGLYAGLYCLGAVTSLGKTTFCLQMADNIAAMGYDVLFFSLEMGRHELMARSLSRLTFLESMKKGTTIYAKTARSILTGAKYNADIETDNAVMEAALDSYRLSAGSLYISEGLGDIGVKEVRAKVEQFKRATGGRPPSIIFVDYLQILAPADPRSTDKQNTDKAVLELKRISRDYNMPVIAVSSFNRDNYTAPVNLTSFKESGAVEYSSDVLIGLQYEGMDYEKGEKDNQREARIRDLKAEVEENSYKGEAVSIQVKVLKNRSGRKGSTMLSLRSKFNIFTVPEDYLAPNLDSSGNFVEGETPLKWKKVEARKVKKLEGGYLLPPPEDDDNEESEGRSAYEL